MLKISKSGWIGPRASSLVTYATSVFCWSVPPAPDILLAIQIELNCYSSYRGPINNCPALFALLLDVTLVPLLIVIVDCHSNRDCNCIYNISISRITIHPPLALRLSQLHRHRCTKKSKCLRWMSYMHYSTREGCTQE